MRSFLLLLSFTILSVSCLFLSCTKDKKTDDNNNTNGFDKTAMLTQYADQLILPGYQKMQDQVSALQTASEAFISTPSTATQNELKTAFTAAYLQYQRVAAFQFGPAETALLDAYVNYSGGLDYNFNTDGELTGFSVDTATIEANISSGSYTLNQPTRKTFYAQGFPALGYLYFGENAIARLDGKRAAYIRSLTDRLKALTDKVSSDWNAYRSTFISNTQTNVGSPIGNLVNQLAYQMDILKGPRIGWPFGKQSGGVIFATKCEGYYAGISVALAVENLSSLRKLYTAGNSGKGLSDYLVALNQGTLNSDVLSQFDAAISKLSAIPDPLSQSLTTQTTAVDAAYKEIQKLLTLLKTDVASATAVQITFMDNDGD
ncbi:MAG: imelysin family protein [Chitinophagaceae bacterium]